MENELLVIESASVLEAFATPDGLKPLIGQAREIVEAFDHDMSSGVSRGKTKTLANKVARLKTKLDGLGKDLVSEWKDKAKVVDSHRKLMRDELDELKTEARRPLSDWEIANEERVQKHKANILLINSVVSVESLNEMIRALKTLQTTVINEDYEEFQEEAEEARLSSIETLQRMILVEEDRVSKERELKELRAELAERKKADEERVKAEGEQKKAKEAEETRIKAEEEAQAKAKADAEATKEREEYVAEQARLTEVERVKQEKEKEAAAQAKKEANKRHVNKINKQVRDDLMRVLVLDSDVADQIIDAVLKGKVRNMSINY